MISHQGLGGWLPSAHADSASQVSAGLVVAAEERVGEALQLGRDGAPARSRRDKASVVERRRGGERKDSDVALIDGHQLLVLESRLDGTAVTELVDRARPAVVAVDSPHCCAQVGRTSQDCERQLATAVRWSSSGDPGATASARLRSGVMSRPVAKGSLSARARAKDASRRRDERARAFGRKSASRLRRENEVFGELAASASVRLLASRSLG
jgi:hypothetical protein